MSKNRQHDVYLQESGATEGSPSTCRSELDEFDCVPEEVCSVLLSAREKSCTTRTALKSAKPGDLVTW